jgi:thiamine biosynthesis lipoprotein
MASPWEVHVAGAVPPDLQRVTDAVAEEVWRLERKYSRYRDDSLLHRINHAGGQAVSVDVETARLLNYALTLWRVSEGRFDISTGALRRAWTFDGSDRVPEQSQIDALLPCVGWDKAEWDGESLRLPPGMEIDFGGIGKEYAVDRALGIAQSLVTCPVLINGGGDLAASAPPQPGQTWRVGIDGDGLTHAPLIKLSRGALATSGDARRYLLKDGKRYSHVLDPRSGWPVQEAPQSVTVLAKTCTEAGSHSTLALLSGADAERYLGAQDDIQ